MKKILCLLFALLLLIGCAACTTNSGTEETKSTLGDEETGDDDRLTASDGLPETSFGGAKYRVSCTDTYAYEVYSTDTQDVCDAAVYKRNLKIEERFDVEIVPVITPMGNQLNHEKEIMRIHDAGDDVYDIIMMQVWRAGTLVMEGYFRDWHNDVPGVDFEQPWWTTMVNDIFTINDALYVAAGDIALTSLQGTFAYLFNQARADDLKIENLYDVVREDRWTIDYVNTLVKDVYTDVNKNQERDIEDAYGFVTATTHDASAYLYAFNLSLTGQNEDGELVLMLDEAKADTVYEKVHDLFLNNSGSYAVLTDKEYNNKIGMFTSGNALLSAQSLSVLYKQVREMKDPFGVLPYPKLNEEQEHYYSGGSNNWSVACIPIAEADLKMVGYITEALCCETYRTVIPAYYDVALKDKYTDSDDDEEMLDLILAGKRSDLAILYGPTLSGMNALFRYQLQKQADNFHTAWNENKIAYQSALWQIEATYERMAEDDK
ncbi:MAG: hypothetical protein E7618_02865 [Ruminococcaceae bacterium]|nr:hypothetical protein [Oscillospiraceae bacterium]